MFFCLFFRRNELLAIFMMAESSVAYSVLFLVIRLCYVANCLLSINLPTEHNAQLVRGERRNIKLLVMHYRLQFAIVFKESTTILNKTPTVVQYTRLSVDFHRLIITAGATTMAGIYSHSFTKLSTHY